MHGPLTAREIMMRFVDPLYQSHIDTNYQVSGGYMNASPAVPVQPYEGTDMHLDPYQGSDTGMQEQFVPTPEPDFHEFEEMEDMAQMEDISYDPVGMNESFINQSMEDFFGDDTLDDMLDDPEFDVQRMRQRFFDSF